MSQRMSLILPLIVAAVCWGIGSPAFAEPMTSPLDDLQWMVGVWKAELGGAELRLSAKWDDGGNYIVREFKATKGGKTLESIEQRIAHDPTKKALHIWGFESKGGLSDGTIRKDGDGWIVESDCVSPNGSKSISTTAYSSISPNSFTVTASVKRASGETPKQTIEFARDSSATMEASNPTTPSSMSPEKAAILASPEWQELRRDYQDWLSVQKKYDQAALDDMKAELQAKIAAMSADELKEMIKDAEKKLGLLLTPEAASARDTLGKLVAFKVHGDSDSWKNRHNDLVTMSPQQLEQEMTRIKQKREALARNSAADAAARQMQIQAVQQQRAEHQRALDREAYDNGGYHW